MPSEATRPYLTVVAAILVSLLPAVSLAYRSLEIGVVSPPNPFHFVGGSLNLDCNITNPNATETSSNLFFEFGDQAVPTRQVRVLTTRAIRLRVPEVGLEHDGFYTCVLRRFRGPEVAVAHQHVQIDHYPEPVVNDRCWVYNWEQMTCTWELGVTYKYPKHVNVSVYWVSTDKQQDCPKLTQTSCVWDGQHYQHGSTYRIKIVVSYRVRGKALEERPVTTLRTVNTWQLKVKPAPVQHLEGVAESSTCIRLSWQLSPVVFDRAKKFTAEVQTGAGQLEWTRTSLSGLNSHLNASLMCGLKPNTEYRYRVAVVPVAVAGDSPGGNRSDWRSVTVSTQEDVPSAAPSTCLGCYFDLSDVMPLHSRDARNSRRVRILWKDIPEVARHGTLTHYQVRYSGLTSRQSYNATVAARAERGIPVTSADLDLPSRQESYDVKIAGVTSRGESPVTSFIFIPALEKKPSPPQGFLVERSNHSSRFFLSWRALVTEGHHVVSGQPSPSRYSQQLAVTDLYVVWCRADRRQRWKCRGDLEWVRLPPGEVRFELRTNLTDSKADDLLIGISAQVISGQETLTSGIHWSNCIYIQHQIPRSKPLDVRVSPTPPSEDGLVVLWERPGCREERSHVTEYLVSYCPVATTGILCVGKELTSSVNSSVTRETLSGLTIGTRYRVQVQAVSTAGLGPHSDYIFHTLMSTPLEKEETLDRVLIIVAIILALAFIAFCICMVRCCYRQKRKVPNINGLLDIDPTRKNEPVYRHRGRPLPEPPSDTLNDHHIYGSDGRSACMNNLGFDKKSPALVSEHSSSKNTGGGTDYNIPLIIGCCNPSATTAHARPAPRSEQGMGDHHRPGAVTRTGAATRAGVTTPGLEHEVASLLEPAREEEEEEEDVVLKNAADAGKTSNTLHRLRSSAGSSTLSYHVMGVEEHSGNTRCTEETPPRPDLASQAYDYAVCVDNAMSVDFSNKNTLPLRSHWPRSPEVTVFQAMHGGGEAGAHLLSNTNSPASKRGGVLCPHTQTNSRVEGISIPLCQPTNINSPGTHVHSSLPTEHPSYPSVCVPIAGRAPPPPSGYVPNIPPDPPHTTQRGHAAHQSFRPDPPPAGCEVKVDTSADQEFCTCDCDSSFDDADDVDGNDNLRPQPYVKHNSAAALVGADKQGDATLNNLTEYSPSLPCPSPPPSPPNDTAPPSPPNAVAPPLPSNASSRGLRQTGRSKLPELGSTEYLEPQTVFPEPGSPSPCLTSLANAERPQHTGSSSLASAQHIGSAPVHRQSPSTSSSAASPRHLPLSGYVQNTHCVS